mgnify:CR=1 FL=1
MTMRKVVNRRGKTVTLLNPAEKGNKYAVELKCNVHCTNYGDVKLDKRGHVKTLSKQSRAYRAGYLSSRKDSANAYKSAEAKAKEAKAAKKKVAKVAKVHM